MERITKTRKTQEAPIQLWATEKVSWQQAIEDENVLFDIVDELVDKHIRNSYAKEEIVAAFESVLNQSSDAI